MRSIGTVTLRILYYIWNKFCYIWGKLVNILGWQQLKLKIGRLIWKNDDCDDWYDK